MKHERTIVGAKVRELRKAAKLTQLELSKRLDVGLRFVRDLEQGKITTRMDKVNLVLDFFGYHLEAVKNERAI